jgi:hypothetical protein
VVHLAGVLAGKLAEVIRCGGGIRGDIDNDLNELVVPIHTIQRAVMANAAARAYPDLYRRLGGRPPKGRAT